MRITDQVLLVGSGKFGFELSDSIDCNVYLLDGGDWWDSDRGRALLSGDAIFARGRIVSQYIWDCSIQEYAESIFRLDQLHFDALYPGHGTFLLGQAHAHVGLAAAALKRLELPQNL